MLKNWPARARSETISMARVTASVPIVSGAAAAGGAAGASTVLAQLARARALSTRAMVATLDMVASVGGGTLPRYGRDVDWRAGQARRRLGSAVVPLCVGAPE